MCGKQSFGKLDVKDPWPLVTFTPPFVVSSEDKLIWEFFGRTTFMAHTSLGDQVF